MRIIHAEPAECPWPVRRVRGALRAGLKYERDCAKALPTAIHGSWFKYWDEREKSHFCSPDLLFRMGRSEIVVIECKLSITVEAWEQIELYRKVVELVYGVETKGLVLTKHLSPSTNLTRVFESIPAAVASGKWHPIVHWLGKTPLLGLPSRPPPILAHSMNASTS